MDNTNSTDSENPNENQLPPEDSSNGLEDDVPPKEETDQNPEKDSTESTNEPEKAPPAKVRQEPELDRSIFQLAIHPVEELVKNITTYPSDRYEKTGFYLAIDPEGVPLEDAKKRLREETEKEVANLDKHADQVREHIAKQKEEISTSLKELEERIKEQKNKLATVQDGIETLEKDRLQIREQIDEIKHDIRKIVEKIGIQREDIIQRRIQSMRSELEEMISTYEEVSNRKASINEKEFAANKEIYKQRSMRYEELYQMAKERLSLVQTKLKKVPGITNQSHQFLFWAGVGAAGGAGWYFSVYIVNHKMFTADFFSFFFSRLFAVGGKLSGSSMGMQVLVLLSGLFLVIAMTTLLSWLGQKYLLKNLGMAEKTKKQTRKESKKQKNQNALSADPGLETDLSLSFGDDEKSYYRTRITAGSFFSFWLQALPVIFLLGVLFILLSVSGTDPTEVTKLTSALSGQFIGSSIAFGVAGLLYIYIRLVIDPRLAAASTGDPKSLLEKNWELLVVLAAFVLATLSMVIWPQQTFVAVLGFVAIAFMTGLVVAYAVYYRGLLASDQELKHEIIHLSFAIDNCRRARPLYIMGAEGEQFKYNYLLLMEQMYKLSQIRNMQATELLVGKEMTSQISLSGKVPKREYLGYRLVKNIRKLFVRSESASDPEENETMELSGPESNYYQEQSLLHRSLKIELKNKRAGMFRLEEKLENLRTENSEVQRRYRDQINDSEWRKKSLIEARERLDRLLIDSVNILQQEKGKRVIALRDGFDLGLWHRTNDVTPRPKYNFDGIPTPTNPS